MIHSLFIPFFNLKERIHHHILPEEIELVKKTQLFENLKDEDFNSLCNSIKLVAYPAGKQIFKEGEQSHALFIIKEGSVRVFTFDHAGVKIPLARLNQGDYFGEQSLLGQALKTRAANIETINDSLLIKIDGYFLNKVIHLDPKTRRSLTLKGVKEAFETLSCITNFYNDLDLQIHALENPSIRELTDKEIIFNEGDPPDFVYLIQQGEIKLLIPDPITQKFNQLFLHKGHIFGELGVLQQKPRSGTAMANGNARLLVLSGEDFKKILPKNRSLTQILKKLEQVYQIPLHGAAHQYVGGVGDFGPTLTTVYRSEDGRILTASRFLNQEVFVFKTATLIEGKLYKFSKGGNRVELYVYNDTLTGIKVYGAWDHLPAACYSLLKNKKIEKRDLENFEKTGSFNLSISALKDESKIICDCMMVSKSHLQGFIDRGIKDVESLSKVTGACTACRSCEYRILEMLGKSIWISALLKKKEMHNENICSFLIRPLNGSFKAYKPGQHIIIQIQIEGNWIERPYSISGRDDNGDLRITVKREKGGFLSRYLFDQVNEEISINATHPQGSFTLKEGDGSALCFAGGIGVTPFISFAKENSSVKRLHIVYSALTAKDFVFKEEFELVAKSKPHFSIEYKEGLITDEVIVNTLQLLGEPDIYICGPLGYIEAVKQVLEKVKYPLQKIHIEAFVRAGSKK